MKRIFIFILLFQLCSVVIFAQRGDKLFDGRNTSNCSSCIRLIQEKPKEVLFGIHITTSGEILFSINNSKWFEELLQYPGDGIAVDLVSRDLYDCNKPLPDPTELSKGFVLPIVYLPELKKRQKDLGGGQYSFLIGMIPPHLKDKELEGNLAIIKNGTVCFYTYFVDIPRSVWDFLPMGLYADSLINAESLEGNENSFPFNYSQKFKCSIPFSKNKAALNPAFLKPLFDSLQKGDYHIRKIEISAFSSVEGEAPINQELQQKRAQAIAAEVQKRQLSSIPQKITTNENWEDFYKDIGVSSHPELASLSTSDIRIRLLDKQLLAELEPVLKKHRKAEITVYVVTNNEWTSANEPDLLQKFRSAIEKKELYKASLIQAEVMERIHSNELPSDFIDKLEIPAEKDFVTLLTQKETYKYQLSLSSEREAIEHFKWLLQLEPDNTRLLYNICSLSFEPWKYDSSFIEPKEFYQSISSLVKKGIAPALVKRMLINYHIRMGEIHLARYEYAKKDSSVDYIRKQYGTLIATDKEMVSMAKYLSYYSHREWAMELLQKRVDAPDVSEDLLFYYINLYLFDPMAGNDEQFKKAARNAIRLHKERYCQIFNSVSKGGASFQLLDNEGLKKIFCESCNK